MALSAPFSSEQEAENTYYGSGSGDGDGSGDDGDSNTPTNESTTWGELQRSGTLGSGWVLAYQKAVNSDRRRWFAIRMSGDTLQALKSSGQVYEAKESDSLGQLPHYDTADDAREAFEKWAQNGGEKPPNAPTNESTTWGEWRKVRKVGPWFIFGRTSKSGDKAQFIVAGKRDGSAIYLAPEGEITDAPHIYDTIQAAKNALDAYSQAVQDGEIPAGMQPNGNVPNTSTVREAVSKVVRTAQSRTKTNTTTKLAGKKVLLGAVAVGGLAILTRGEQSK